MELSDFLASMQRLAPLELAEEWDNVGLLVAPTRPRAVERILLTIDLTQRVLDEALDLRVDAIVAYHPPIFSGLKQLVPSSSQGALLLRVIENGLVVYSPHTALDAVDGGVNDWLAAAFSYDRKRPLQPRGDASAAVGQGRWLELCAPLDLQSAVAALKTHLGVPWLRVAHSVNPTRPISTVALCAGAGGSVVNGSAADLIVTGEMRHHDVLRATENGTSVVLSEHTNSERGYLPGLRARLCEAGFGFVAVSERDRDPLSVV